MMPAENLLPEKGADILAVRRREFLNLVVEPATDNLEIKNRITRNFCRKDLPQSAFHACGSHPPGCITYRREKFCIFLHNYWVFTGIQERQLGKLSFLGGREISMRSCIATDKKLLFQDSFGRSQNARDCCWRRADSF
jgi:hypothetical protein